MELIEAYQELPDSLRNQISYIEKNYDINNDVKEYYKHIVEKIGKDKLKTSGHKKILMRLAILTVIKPFELMTQDMFSFVHCYTENSKSKITLKKLLKEGKHARVIEGRDSKGKVVIVKWYSSEKRDTCFESGIYEKLREDQCTLPWFSTDYYFWNTKVLVLEKLKKLDATDDEFELALQLLPQLKKLHVFGVHCDIKPLNIMKKKKNGQTIYLLIDFGGIAYERFEHGFRRWLWSPSWTSQESHTKNQATTMKADFVELGYTMKYLQNLRKKRKKDEVRSGFRGKLKRYMDYVIDINEKNIPEDIHDKIIEHIKNLK